MVHRRCIRATRNQRRFDSLVQPDTAVLFPQLEKIDHLPGARSVPVSLHQRLPEHIEAVGHKLALQGGPSTISVVTKDFLENNQQAKRSPRPSGIAASCGERSSRTLPLRSKKCVYVQAAGLIPERIREGRHQAPGLQVQSGIILKLDRAERQETTATRVVGLCRREGKRCALIAGFTGILEFVAGWRGPGSLIVICLWIYSSSQIFFFGGEVTQVLSARRRRDRSRAEPKYCPDESDKFPVAHRCR